MDFIYRPTNEINELVGITHCIAADFRARLRFPRAAAEPPRRYAPAGSHPFRFSRRSLRLALQSTTRNNEIDKIYVHHDNKKPDC
ncbi:hypothetical protein [Priestia sp. SIMBA_032]|uniref:hypothetical protein n=1 Tax=Priestia TaxID=2800373 RepID=UPI003978F23B